jgi:hypothetical protein
MLLFLVSIIIHWHKSGFVMCMNCEQTIVYHCLVALTAFSSKILGNYNTYDYFK